MMRYADPGQVLTLLRELEKVGQVRRTGEAPWYPLASHHGRGPHSQASR